MSVTFMDQQGRQFLNRHYSFHHLNHTDLIILAFSLSPPKPEDYAQQDNTARTKLLEGQSSDLSYDIRQLAEDDQN